MDIISKAKLFNNFSIAFGKTHKILETAQSYLPKNFTKLTDMFKNSSELRAALAEDYVINQFYKPLSKKLGKAEFDSWKMAVKAAVISKTVCAWMEHGDMSSVYLNCLVRDLPLIVLRNEDKESYRLFEQKVLEGKTIPEASLVAFGIGLSEYMDKFAQTFKYEFPDAQSQKIIDFSYYLAESFSDKEQKASTLWLKCQEEMDKLGLEMSEDKWANQISVMFVKTLEMEAKFK